MNVTPTTRWQLRINNLVFVLLFLAVIGLLAWLSTRYTLQADWTAGGRHTLNEQSVAVAERLDAPVELTAFARESGLVATRKDIAELVARYARHTPHIQLTFVDPDVEPGRVRELGIQVDGEVVVRYAGRSEHLQHFSEQTFTNVLQRLLRGEERQVLFLEGHGERAPHGQANHDLGAFVAQLENRGLRVDPLNLAMEAAIPEDTALLVIAGPRVALLPGEADMLGLYVAQGGNLLWLHDPAPLHGLEPLRALLGVRFHPGVIIDPTTTLFGIDHPAIAIVANYGDHAITRGFNLLTLFPEAAGVELEAGKLDWLAETLLHTAPRSWSETGELAGELAFDPDNDVPGPLAIGAALTRVLPGVPGGAEEANLLRSQRVVVLGDGDFLSNAFLHSQGNLELGTRIIEWLVHDDDLIDIPAKSARDTQLTLSDRAWAVIGLVVLFLLPAALLSSGVVIWARRRKR